MEEGLEQPDDRRVVERTKPSKSFIPELTVCSVLTGRNKHERRSARFGSFLNLMHPPRQETFGT